MLDNIISTVKETHQEKLDDTFEELRREYEWYCVAESNIAQVLHLLE